MHMVYTYHVWNTQQNAIFFWLFRENGAFLRKTIVHILLSERLFSILDPMHLRVNITRVFGKATDFSLRICFDTDDKAKDNHGRLQEFSQGGGAT